MTEGPPPSAASTSKTASGGVNSSQNQLLASPATISSPVTSNSNGKPKQHYAGKSYWPTTWPPQQNGVSPGAAQTTNSTQQMSFLSGSNPYAAHLYRPQAYYPAAPPKPVKPEPSSNSQATTQPKATRSPSPSPLPPDPTAFKDWDDVVKKFLLRTKMTETLKGFESDMLVLNAEWERAVVPEALKEMVTSLQTILDRMAGKAKQDENVMEVDSEVDIMDKLEADELNSLNERKLKYVHLSNGAVPRSQSSINKSISEFLSRTRARNDASNRAEFLFTLAEKKRKMAEELEGSEGEDTAEQGQFSSCARVDAKTIDRDKQMKYDIAKYGEGPLITTVKAPAISPPLPASPDAAEIPAVIQHPPEPVEEIEKELPPVKKTRRKRKLVDSDEEEHDDIPSEKSLRKSRRKGRRKEKLKKEDNEEDFVEFEEDVEEKALSLATAEKHPGLEDRLKNIEAHFAVRFVPTPPRTLLSRLVLLEDHIIKLEKEYPPWAALHFNQPNRGWPPPPRTTPIIVPPHLRAFTSTTTAAGVPPGASGPSSSSSTTQATTPAIGTVPTAADVNAGAGTSAVTKPKKIRSSLHKAVLERMEVQRAMSEMGGKSG